MIEIYYGGFVVGTRACSSGGSFFIFFSVPSGKPAQTPLTRILVRQPLKPYKRHSRRFVDRTCLGSSSAN